MPGSCVVYFNEIEFKNIIFLRNFAVFLQQCTSPLYVPFSVLEYYILVDEVHQ